VGGGGGVFGGGEKIHRRVKKGKTNLGEDYEAVSIGPLPSSKGEGWGNSEPLPIPLDDSRERISMWSKRECGKAISLEKKKRDGLTPDLGS